MMPEKVLKINEKFDSNGNKVHVINRSKTHDERIAILEKEVKDLKDQLAKLQKPTEN